MEGIQNGTDLYFCLKLPMYASEEEITEAFRKQAILCLPDKYPDDKIKAANFRAICQAFAILTDAEARAAYDKVLKITAINSIIYNENEPKKYKSFQDEQYRLQLRGDEARMEYEISRIIAKGSAKLDREIERLHEEKNNIPKEEKPEINPEIEWNSPNNVQIHWHSRAKSHIARYQTAMFTGNKKRSFHEISPNGEISSLVVLPFSKGAVVELITKKPEALAAEKEREKDLANRYKSLKWSDGRPVGIEVTNLKDLPDVITKEEQETDAASLQAILKAAEKKRRKDELIDVLVSKYRVKRRYS